MAILPINVYKAKQTIYVDSNKVSQRCKAAAMEKVESNREALYNDSFRISQRKIRL